MDIKAFIIDDEAPARRELKYLIEQAGGVNIVGEADNGVSGLKGIRKTKPNIVFIDIQMPLLNGLELSDVLYELPHKPLLIFATAYEKYAVKSFDVEAFDYILKPFTIERIKKTIKRAERFLQDYMTQTSKGEPSRIIKKETFDVKKIPLYKGESIIPTSPAKIIFALCRDGEIYVQTADGRYKTKATLNELETKLSPHGFIRVHRSSLVNINHVLEIAPWFNGSYKLIMNNKERTEVSVSRYNAKELKKHFDL